jgi:tRNA-uridine 2-sulfurtransferase
MSGGVDSSTAAALLKGEGHDVIGIGLRFPTLGASCDTARSCCGARGMDDARKISWQIGIRFYALNYERIFEECVVDYFCRSYMAGQTPNPCVECNRVVKFGHLLKMADALDADFLATGHYAQCGHDRETGRYWLRKGADAERDQSYFLHALSQQQLSRAMFPLGDVTKDKVRQQAKALGLHVSEKPGSQDICFVPGGDYRELLAHRCPESLAPGPIVNRRGEVLGHHRGIGAYTVGQRRGLRIAARQPLYVLAVDGPTRTVVVGAKEELRRDSLTVRDANWVSRAAPEKPIEVKVKIRYRQPELAASVESLPRGRAIVRFHRAPTGVAAGQSAVFYEGDLVVGGGIIEPMPFGGT